MPAAYIPILLFAALTLLLPAAWLAMIRAKAAKPASATPSETPPEHPVVVAEEITVVASETADGPMVEEIIIEKIAAEIVPTEPALAAPVIESLAPAKASLFFLLAALFVIFSVAIILALPWALRFRSWIEQGRGTSALVAIVVFFAILLVGYAWLRKQNLFDEQPSASSSQSS
jgi:NADH-ubiquinone/plastoquinone oxidoreductase, chain 3